MGTEQLKFKFEGYRITFSEIRISPNDDLDRKLNLNFSSKKSEIQDSNYFLDLGVSVSNQEKSIEISVEMRGFFIFDREISESEKKTFFTGSAPAIMFPYLRAYISNATAMAGIQPIVLPTINFAESLRKRVR